MPFRSSRRTVRQGTSGSGNVHVTREGEEAAPIGIVLVDSHPVVLAGMAKIFSENTRYRVIGASASLAEARDISAAQPPDILIGDIELDSSTLPDVIKSITETITKKVIVFTDVLNVDVAVQAIKAGVSGIILKDAGMEEVVDAVWRVYCGELFVAHGFARQILHGIIPKKRRNDDNESVIRNIREDQILELICNAYTNREIAKTLSLSEKTVKRYVSVLMQKMNAKNRVQLAIYAQKYIGRK